MLKIALLPQVQDFSLPLYFFMQAVILAAGQGTRLRPITYHVPKPMIRIVGKNLIEHNIDRLPEEIDEIILVVGYLSEQLINHFGNEFQGRKVRYVKQQNLLGTGHALHLCKNILQDRFLVMMGDDIYSREDMEKCLNHEQCMLTKEISGKFAGGRVSLDENGCLRDIIEGVHNRDKSLVNTALYVINKNFFDYDLVSIPGKDEYGLPQTLVRIAKDHPIKIEKADFWLQISDIAGLRRAEKILSKDNE